MLASIQRFFTDKLQVEAGEDGDQQRVQLAAAALLIELSKADAHTHAKETATIVSLLRDTFGLDSAELETLLELADKESQDATSTYQFTELINAHYNKAEKQQLIRAMWRVAYADGNVDKYEEHLIRKIADLIYVQHSDFIKLKLAAERDFLSGQSE